VIESTSKIVHNIRAALPLPSDIPGFGRRVGLEDSETQRLLSMTFITDRACPQPLTLICWIRPSRRWRIRPRSGSSDNIFCIWANSAAMTSFSWAAVSADPPRC
jgi:hypothetical protein